MCGEGSLSIPAILTRITDTYALMQGLYGVVAMATPTCRRVGAHGNPLRMSANGFSETGGRLE